MDIDVSNRVLKNLLITFLDMLLKANDLNEKYA